jgi:hypothetical protein
MLMPASLYLSLTDSLSSLFHMAQGHASFKAFVARGLVVDTFEMARLIV